MLRQTPVRKFTRSSQQPSLNSSSNSTKLEMLGFLLLMLVALANAGKLSYHYQRSEAAAVAAPPAAPQGGLFNAQDSRYPGLIDESQQQQTQQYQQQQFVGNDEFSKEFFTYMAPEEDFVDHDAAQRVAGMLKRNLRVLFIKAPEQQGLTNAALQLAKQASEQRTAVYVLTKQSDVGELAQRLQNSGEIQAPRPEVHFVKYRTPEEALHAQRVIQQEFDALGGTTRNSDGGVAPVLDFTSAPAAPVNIGGSSSEQGLPVSAYLPASKRRRR